MNYVAWSMLDGKVMVGKLLEIRPGFNGDYVERIDGTRCYVAADKLREATEDEFNSAVVFYRDIGKEALG